MAVVTLSTLVGTEAAVMPDICLNTSQPRPASVASSGRQRMVQTLYDHLISFLSLA